MKPKKKRKNEVCSAADPIDRRVLSIRCQLLAVENLTNSGRGGDGGNIPRWGRLPSLYVTQAMVSLGNFRGNGCLNGGKGLAVKLEGALPFPWEH